MRRHAVVYRGGSAPAIVFVGEAPGREEDAQGIPFVGRSGHLLDEAIATLRLAPDDFGIVNLLKCRPPDNRFDPRAAATCRTFLDRQLALLRPRLVVTLGARALRSLDPEAPPLLRAAGAPRTDRAPPIFPLLHPAATFRARAWRQRWEADVVRLEHFLRDSLGKPI